MHDPTAPEIRVSIQKGLERQGYQIENPRVPALWTRAPERSRFLREGMVFRDREPILAIMRDPRYFLVVTAYHGAYEGAPYRFGFQEAEEARAV
jgi:hypothetical protein